MLSPREKRHWLSTKERELEAIRRMCAYYALHGGEDSDAFYQDFKIVHEWWMRHKGIFANVPAPEPKG